MGGNAINIYMEVIVQALTEESISFIGIWMAVSFKEIPDIPTNVSYILHSYTGPR